MRVLVKGQMWGDAVCSWGAESRLSEDLVERSYFSFSVDGGGLRKYVSQSAGGSGPAASSQTPTSPQGLSDAALSGNIGTYTVGAH